MTDRALDRADAPVRAFPFSLYEAVDREDWDALGAMFDEQAIYERPGFAPLLGRAEIVDFYRGTRDVRRGHHQLTDVIATGARVVCQGRFSCLTRSERRLKTDFCDVYALKDGLVVRRRTFFFTEVI